MKELFLDKDDPYVIVGLNHLARKGNAIAWLMCGHINSKMREACDLYLYQTDLLNVRKFGISQDAFGRKYCCTAKEKWRYQELLAHKTFPERWQALLIESALKDAGKPATIHRQEEDRYLGIELSSITIEEFLAFIENHLEELEEENIQKFCMKYCKTDGLQFAKKIEYLREGLVSIWWDPYDKRIHIADDIDVGKSGAKFNYKVRKSARGFIPIVINEEAEKIVQNSINKIKNF